jgi:putative endonuclease
MYYIYVLWSSKLQKRYIGSTDIVGKRINEHNRGSNKFTKGGIPWTKIYQEEFQTKTEALKREKFLKSGQGRAWLDEKLNDFWKDAGVVFSLRLIRLWRKLALRE